MMKLVAEEVIGLRRIIEKKRGGRNFTKGVAGEIADGGVSRACPCRRCDARADEREAQ